MPRLWLSSFAAVAALFFPSATGSDLASGVVWYVDITASGTDDGTSWVDAFNDLQDALGVARGGDEIWVAAGTYTPDRGTGDRSATFQLVSGVGLYGGFAGWETQGEQRKPGINETILSGDVTRNDGPRDCAEHSNCCVAHEPDVGCDDPTCEALVCQLQPGCCDPDIPPHTWGTYCADIAQWECCDLGNWNSCENSYVVVTGSGTDQSTILDGFTICAAYADAVRDGLDIFGAGMVSETGSPQVSDCVFRDNVTDGVWSWYESDMRFKNCQFLDNVDIAFLSYASDPVVTDSVFIGNGGGIFSVGNPTITDCLFAGNWIGLSTDGNARVTGCTFVDNHSLGMESGGGRPVVTDCAFIANRKTAMGVGWGYAEVTNCAFIGNAHGGLGVSFAGATISNCIFSGNTDPQGAAGIGSTEGWLEIKNCTFFGNVEGSYEGTISLYDARATVSNCILWGNINRDGASESAQIYLWGDATVTVKHSVVQGWTGALGGIGNTGADPLLADPDGPDDMPGTEDDDLRLSAGSPCINQGDPGLTPDPGETDLDGNPRLQGCRVDMGAYESDALQALGDFDGNSRFDLSDFAGFEICLGAEISNPSWLEACVCAFDFNQSQTLDLVDFAAFRKSLTGP